MALLSRDFPITSLPLAARQRLAIVAAVIIVMAVPLIGNPLILNMFIFVGLYTIVCLGLTLIFGYAGQLSLTQSAFYGVGAYTSAILTTKVGLSFWIALPAAGLISAAMAYVLGAPILRLRYFYLAGRSHWRADRDREHPGSRNRIAVSRPA
jgi:branched-chain amino acid transport system permease protein